MLLDRIGPPGRCRGGGVVMIYWFRRPRFALLCQPYAREGHAVVCPLLRGRSPTRSVAPKQHRGLRRAFSPASLGAWLPKNLARRNSDLLVSAARCCSTGSGRL